MTGRAPVGLDRSMFINKRALLIRVTFNASCIRTGGQSCLFQFKTAMRVVAIAAAHRAFKHLVVKGLIELVLYFAVATQAKLRVACFQHPQRRKAGLFSVRGAHKSVRCRDVPPVRGRV